jgi:hypothetical protein
LANFSYKKNARELSQLIKNKPHTPEETFVKYSEFAARFDLHSKLDMNGRHLSFIKFYNIDVFVAILVVVFLVISVVFLIGRCVIRRLIRMCRKIKTE